MNCGTAQSFRMTEKFCFNVSTAVNGPRFKSSRSFPLKMLKTAQKASFFMQFSP